MLLGEDGTSEPDRRGPIREDPDDVGSAADLLVQPLGYPALRVGSTRITELGSEIETLQMVGQRVNDTMLTGSFLLPASLVGIDLESLDIGALCLEHATEKLSQVSQMLV
ncbi:hypothetical protein [Rhodococcus aetherivorans]|uniref:hypothetical protein n=1 Tax=Rhodococcus aetherivorans TaxID=191292 RepID=UPI00374FA437